jgi:hypothetical protein
MTRLLKQIKKAGMSNTYLYLFMYNYYILLNQ